MSIKCPFLLPPCRSGLPPVLWRRVPSLASNEIRLLLSHHEDAQNLPGTQRSSSFSELLTGGFRHAFSSVGKGRPHSVLASLRSQMLPRQCAERLKHLAARRLLVFAGGESPYKPRQLIPTTVCVVGHSGLGATMCPHAQCTDAGFRNAVTSRNVGPV